MSDVLLEASGLCKSFPGVKSLDGVDFTLRAGEIHALMGENGAGKSSLIKVLTGVYGRDAGMVRLRGREIAPASPQAAQVLGICTVYQEVNLIPQLSVAENLYLGRQPRRLGMIRHGEMKRRARLALARLELDLDVAQPLASYSIAIQQLVAIARAFDFEARVLILDEPTSSLDAHEVELLFGVLRKLRAQGLGIVFVTHFMEQVYAVSDRITVLRNGKLVGEFAVAELPQVKLIEAMIGRELEEAPASVKAVEVKQAERGKVVLSAKGAGKKLGVEPFDLELRAGEVVGLAGLLGSGRSEVARLMFGIEPKDAGVIAADGNEVAMRGPREAIGLGFGFCPEDRKSEGIIPNLSIRENIVLVLQGRRGWLRKIGVAQQRALAEGFIATLNIATPDAEKPIRLLSGGNQQKVLLARWLAAEPRLLMLDEPTRGIDVGAKFEIAKLMEELRAKGMAILFISSELEEVARSCQRVAVMRDRKKVAELAGAEISEPAMMRAMAAQD